MSLLAPFTAGMVTDAPAHQIGPQNSAFAQDGFSPSGMFMQRKGWSFDGTTADVADNLVAVYRNKFILADVTRTVTGDDDGDLFIHNSASAGSALFTGSVVYLPRAVYNDELLWCAQDGNTPLRRYAGAASTGTASDLVGTTTDGEGTITAITFSVAPDIGAFVTMSTKFYSSKKIVAASPSSLTLDGLRASSTLAVEITPALTGVTAPCVAVYNAGTVTENGSGTVTGYGTKWNSDISVLTGQEHDNILIIPFGGSPNPRCGQIVSVDSGTSLTWNTNFVGGLSTKSAYSILRKCPFKDVASHKESLWGTGVAWYPNRVYFGPPGWNVSTYPGFELPSGEPVADSPNANDFLMEYRDVPSPFDGDPNVAILSSPNPLLVLKRHAVYGIFGSPGMGLSTDLIADGVGCIDIRSAQSFDEGQFFASEQGIMWYVGGQLRDLTAGKINREWRALVRDFDYGTNDYCSIGLASGHLVVHITTGGGATQRTYLCDLRDQSWQSRLTNVTPRYMFTSRIAGEKEKLLAVQDADQGRVLDLAPMIDGSGIAKDGDGTSPRLQARTTSAIGQANGIEGNTRLIDLDVHANVLDAGAAGSTQMAVSVVSGGGVSNEADSTKTLTKINSDAVDRIDRKSYRVARDGRLHQVRFDVDTLGTNTAATKVEIAQVVATVRDSRGRA